MDFSKIKKIFYIVAIISMILSIKSRVLGATYTIDETYLYDVYDSRSASFILRFNNNASDEVKSFVADLYTSGEYFPYLAVRNTQGGTPSNRWAGLSDSPNMCNNYNHFLLYFVPYNNCTSSLYGTGFMSFPDAQVLKYTSTTSSYMADCYTANTSANYYALNNPEIYTTLSLYGHHSSYLDDYFIGIKYGNTQQILSILQSAENHLKNIDDSLTNTTPSQESENIANDLQNTNNNTGADSINSSFFSNITNLFANIGYYELSDSRTITIPLPHSQQGIRINANYLYNSLPEGFKALIYSFWYFIFGFYAFKFINKIYIAVKSGNILDGFNSNHDVITNDML